MTYTPGFMQKHGIALLDERVDAVTVAVENEPTLRLTRMLEALHCSVVHFRRVDRTELVASMQRCAAADLSSCRYRGHPSEALSVAELSADTPAVNLVNSLVNDAVASGASDIHVVAEREGVAVRYRIDGTLHPGPRLPQRIGTAVASRVKAMACLDIAERRRPQDGRFSARVGNDEFDVRVSTMPIMDGESIVLRVFPIRPETLGLEELGMPANVLSAMSAAISRRGGLVLVSGPTGSGKTTTLHAALRRIATQERSIVTIEDPVEYRLAGIVQIQTNDSIGLAFDQILTRVLRHDPQVIMVGEIRDAATARLAVRAALTGHLVLSTVHTRSSRDVHNRLIDLGVDAGLIESTAPTIVAQRLVRRRCTRCHAGCSMCRGTGYAGRTGLFELYDPAGTSTTLRDDGREKVSARVTTDEEVRWATEL
ncbi:MAG: type II/IV secretion system protein [Spirochaetaceae bacterium]|nr:MAG: type II/IV secretion system protein [Spirochaetaceae bacterium]